MKTLAEYWFVHEKQEEYQEAVAFVAWLSASPEVAESDGQIKEQLDRASVSLALNIADARGKSSALDRCRILDMALSSALQSAAVLDLLVAKLTLSAEDIRPGKELLQRIARLLMEQIKQYRALAGDKGSDNAADAAAVEDLAADLLTDGDLSDLAEESDQEEEEAKPEKAAPPEKPVPTKAKEIEEEREPRVATKYLVILGVLAAIFVAYLLWPSGPDSPDSLVNKALKENSSEERQLAVGALVSRGLKQAPLLQRIAKESDDPEVIVQALNGLSVLNDTSAKLVFVDFMDHDNKRVRETAEQALRKFFGGILPNNIEYKADDPPNVRAEAISKLKEYFNHVPNYLKGRPKGPG